LCFKDDFYITQVTLELMWSFVVQNFYPNSISKTRRLVALKKLHSSQYYLALLKYNTTSFYCKSSIQWSTYYWLYISLFKKSFWSNFNNMLYKNQGLIYNNLTLSYYYRSIYTLSNNNSLLNVPSEYSVLNTHLTLSMPFHKTTFNSLIYISYFLLSGYYISNPMWFKLLHTYTWLSKLFLFDSALNTFYFKIYRY